MGKFKDEEVRESTKWQPSQKDVQELELKLQPFTQKRINGKLQSPFDQYLLSKNITKLDEYGNTLTCDPVAYSIDNETNAKRSATNSYRHKRLMEQYPEEKEKFLAMIHNIGEDMRGVTKKLTVN